MAQRQLGSTGNRERCFIVDATGAFVTGLTFSTGGLAISTIRDDEASPVTYRQSQGTIETITTVGIYAAPTTGKCRFKEVNATYHPGLYEFQFANARYGTGATRLVITVSSVESSPDLNLESNYEIELVGFNPQAAAASTASIAEEVLKHDWTGMTGEAMHSALNALRFILNKWNGSSPLGYIHVYKEDEASVAYSKAILSQPTAEPIIGTGGPG